LIGEGVIRARSVGWGGKKKKQVFIAFGVAFMIGKSFIRVDGQMFGFKALICRSRLIVCLTRTFSELSKAFKYSNEKKGKLQL
jgi:hypothetical protein